MLIKTVLYRCRGGWTRSRTRKKRCVSQCKFSILTKIQENMQIGGSSFVCLLTSLKDTDTVRYPITACIHSIEWISTFDTFLLVLDELQLSATDCTLYFNPLFQITTKNAADPIANVEQVRMNIIIGGAYQRPSTCNAHKSASKSIVLTT